MEVKEQFKDKRRLFELILDDSDLELLMDLDSQGTFSGYTKSGCRFHLYPHPSLFSESFRILPIDTNSYYIYLGDLKVKNREDLEKLILSRNIIPIEIDSVVQADNPINVGYVRFRLK